MPKISVIIPIYGVEKYIERCARSLFEQTLDDIEYLFIDDCTPDRSIEILKQVIRLYPNRASQVIIHRMDHNSGQAAVRKWGMQNATGDYVVHCDSDDWVETDMYRAMYEKAREVNADVVVCDYNVSDGSKNTYVEAFLSTEKIGFIEDMAAMRVSWALWNRIVKREMLDVVYPKCAMGEDMAITLQVCLKANNIAFIREAYYYYMLNPASITRIKDKNSTKRKFEQFVTNSRIVINLIETGCYKDEYRDVPTAIKWASKRLLWQHAWDADVFKLWKSTYSEINVSLLFCPLIKISDKLKYIVTYLKLYPKRIKP